MEDLFADRAIRAKTLSRSDVEILSIAGSPSEIVDCDLEEADLSDLNLTGWTFERCNMRRTKFTGARLEGTRWISCRGPFADFVGVDLSEAVFSASDFNNAGFRRAGLSAAVFRGCKLTGADLTDAKCMDAVFEETLLINAKLPSHSFRKLTLRRLDFSQADIRKCDFRDVVFEACSLRDANMHGSRFEGADLRGADIGGLRLMDAALFRGATISREQAGQLLGELGLNVR
ncbi:pentapeptide repeat-containing protein [Sphingomonas sp. KC8]|uniref:pentapeptide repeat-containing protein n=1 Tax=Sphingomonas sp. KC8 TaxID=1030157 RepID=UPI0004955357|nr:pentapeptide repeat-containing protein [Sphingomonas sp. KC8]